jgi:hypothetical protein
MKDFETNSFTMKVHTNGLVEFKVKRNVTMQESDVWESQNMSVEYLQGKKVYVLMETEDNFDVTVDARRAGASERYAQHVNALALYSTRLHETILGNLFLKVSRPKVKTRFFDNRDKALEWLKSQM